MISLGKVLCGGHIRLLAKTKVIIYSERFGLFCQYYYKVIQNKCKYHCVVQRHDL